MIRANTNLAFLRREGKSFFLNPNLNLGISTVPIQLSYEFSVTEVVGLHSQLCYSRKPG